MVKSHSGVLQFDLAPVEGEYRREHHPTILRLAHSSRAGRVPYLAPHQQQLRTEARTAVAAPRPASASPPSCARAGAGAGAGCVCTPPPAGGLDASRRALQRPYMCPAAPRGVARTRAGLRAPLQNPRPSSLTRWPFIIPAVSARSAFARRPESAPVAPPRAAWPRPWPSFRTRCSPTSCGCCHRVAS